MTSTDPAQLLRAAGLPVGPLQTLTGGDIGHVVRSGAHVVKTMDHVPPGLFASEARALGELGRRGCRVPEVLHVEEAGIVLSYLPPGAPDWVGLARQLARLHNARVEPAGSDTPVFLGRFGLPAGTGDFPTVWRDLRLAPLFEATAGTLGRVAREVEHAMEWVPPLEGSVYVHGDLWSGNVWMSDAGAALIDPSGWVGERAVDLAMMQLFGGFPPAFWSAYEAEAPIPPDVSDALPWYQLYFLLAHVCFFGESYVSGVLRAARSVGQSSE